MKMLYVSTVLLGIALLGVHTTSVAQSKAVNQCMSFDTTSNSLADFVVNSFSFSIQAAWKDQGLCDIGCGTGVAANGRESINKLTGNTAWIACRHLVYAK